MSKYSCIHLLTLCTILLLQATSVNAKSSETARHEPDINGRMSSAKGQWTRFKALTVDEYSEFCEKLPRAELYRCRGCSFVHRFPSKVRRHFHYRHSVVPPYRCGHCSFRAVERGKVVKHSRSAHPSQKPTVLTRDDGDVPSSKTISDYNDSEETFPRHEEGRKTRELSCLRNVTKPQPVSASFKHQTNLDRTKYTDETVYTKTNKTANMSTPSSEHLSSKQMEDDDSFEESDATEDYDSSDEYQPPSSKTVSYTHLTLPTKRIV